jgi:small-conductance mechanosensitive channel
MRALIGRLVSFDGATAPRIVLTAAVIVGVLLLRTAVVGLVRITTRRAKNDRVIFWTHQGANLAAAALILVALLAIWFNDAARLATFGGFVTAGLAIAAQRVITAFAGYLIIIRGKTFMVGERIKMGGVRGDVIALGFLQTRILEMGQPPDVNEQEDPGMWVRARQFTGRVVTITNDKVFDEPIYNFTREFPYIFEEVSVGVGFRADHQAAERILIDAATRMTGRFADESRDARAAFAEKYNVELDDPRPHVYWRLTDNWLELTTRFMVPEHGIREIKDRLAREILKEFNAAHIDIASTTFEIVGAPPLRIERSVAREAKRAPGA